MPPAVLLPPVRPMSRRRAGLPPRAFVFAYPFDPNSYMARKNPIALVRAFRQAFAEADDSVALLLRVNGTPDAAQPAWRELDKAIAGDSRIIVRDGTLDRADAFALLATCDALVSPHRSEGFGRNIAEAILLGLPVRATGFSGCVDFLRPAETVAWTDRAVAPGEYPFGEGQVWAEPDHEHLVAALRDLRAGARPEPARAAAFAATHDAAPVGARVAGRVRVLLGQARS
jgi:glycosyltransferase involved in cell wall biosynthesis